MAISAHYLLFDCEDHDRARQAAEFWSAAMGTPVAARNGSLQAPVPVADGLRSIFSDNFPAETRTASRLHVVFTVREGTMSEEVDRLLGLGAGLIDDRRREGFHGAGWVILADPVGNEFRVESNDAEVAAVEE